MRPTVVLVGDVVADRKAAVATRSFDADKPTQADIATLSGWLEEAHYNYTVFDSVREFVTSASQIPASSIVLPLWRGGASRNRTTTVPALCEELGLFYVGGDVFVQTVSQDKSLSKVFCRKAGFRVPGEWLLPSRKDLQNFTPSQRLGDRFVVKPQYSAASIGIEDRALCRTDGEAKEWALELFDRRLGPLVCEEFIEGDEISLCLIEERGTIIERCVAAVLDLEGAYPYRDRLLTFDEKARDDDGCEMRAWPYPVDPHLWECAATLVGLLGKTDMLRVDGRLADGRFTVIELTQDPNFAIDSELVGGFNDCGLSPPAFFDRLIQASYRSQAS
jgi:D-alanine-D-alanine ligase